MLISQHAVFSTLEAPFLPAGWQLAVDSTFGISNVNSITANAEGRYLAVGSAGKAAISDNNAFTWTSVNPQFNQSNIYAAAYGDDIFMIGGSSGKIATSSDGENWTIRNSGFGASPVLGLSYSSLASLWIAVGGSGKLATSIDGIEWVLRSSSFGTTYINKVFSSSDKIIAVGYDGKLATSTNGTSWTQRTSSFIFSNIYSVTAKPSNDLYVAVGDIGKIAVSPNGLSWSQLFPGSSFGASSINAVAANDIAFLAGGALGKIATSTTTEQWTQRVSQLGLDTINDLYLDANIGIAVGNNGKIAYSA